MHPDRSLGGAFPGALSRRMQDDFNKQVLETISGGCGLCGLISCGEFDAEFWVHPGLLYAT